MKQGQNIIEKVAMHHIGENITLRDFFAGCALIGNLMPYVTEQYIDKELAIQCYKQADTMLAEREKEGRGL